jgi:hypothetical protein
MKFNVAVKMTVVRSPAADDAGDFPAQIIMMF